VRPVGFDTVKVCYICADHGIPILGRKGCSTHVRETVRSLQGCGHKTFVLTANAGDDHEGNSEIEIIEIPPLRKKWLGSDLRHYFYNFRAEGVARRLFAERKPDVIYERYSLYSTVGARLARRYNLPRILEVNSFLVQEQRTRLHLPAIAERVEKHILLRARHVIVLSALLRDGFSKLGVPDERMTIMPMAVDVKRFRSDVAAVDLCELADVSAGSTTVGYIGTLSAWHGIDLLHQIAREFIDRSLPITIVVIGGDPGKVAEHRRRVAEAGVGERLKFVGSVPYHDVPRYLSALDITLIPASHPWSSPTKLFEYQAMAKPSIAPRLAPVQEAMTHGEEGLLFEPDNVEEMIDQIVMLHESPELRDKMGLASRERVVRSHAWEHNVEGIIEIFDRLIREKQQSNAGD